MTPNDANHAVAAALCWIELESPHPMSRSVFANAAWCVQAGLNPDDLVEDENILDVLRATKALVDPSLDQVSPTIDAFINILETHRSRISGFARGLTPVERWALIAKRGSAMLRRYHRTRERPALYATTKPPARTEQ